MLFPVFFAFIISLLINIKLDNIMISFNEINDTINKTDDIYIDMSTYFSYCRYMQNWKQDNMYCHYTKEFPDLDQTNIYVIYDVFVMDLQNKQSCKILLNDDCRAHYEQLIGQNFYKNGLVKSNLNVIFPHNFFGYQYNDKNFTVNYYLNFNHHVSKCEPLIKHKNKIMCKENSIMQNKNISHKEIILKDKYEYVVSGDLSTSMEQMFVNNELNKLMDGEHVLTKKYYLSINEYNNPHLCAKYN